MRKTLTILIFCFFQCYFLIGQTLDCTTFNPPDDCMLSPRACDSLELLKFYCALDGPNWNTTLFGIHQTPWDLSKPISTWGGVVLTADSMNVLDLEFSGYPDWNLSGLNLSGFIPNMNLPELDEIDIAGNNVTQISHIEEPEGMPKLRIFKVIKSNAGGELPQLTNNPLVWYIDFSENNLEGTLPNYDSLTDLSFLYLDNNNLGGFISPFFGLGRDTLERISLSSNNFQGTFPQFNAPNLIALGLVDNSFDSLSPQPNTALNDTELFCHLGLRASNNKLTFDDIIPFNKDALVTNCNGIPNNPIRYQNQQLFGEPKLFQVSKCTDLKIDLGIDAEIDDNIYRWFKAGIPIDTIVGDNCRLFENLDLEDDGTYVCRVTNPQVPGLTLESHPITISINQNTLSCICPDDNFNIEVDNDIACWNSDVTLILNNTQPELTYEIFANNISTGIEVNGSGSDMIIINSIQETTIFSVFVKDSNHSCDFGFLENVVVVTTPSPDFICNNPLECDSIELLKFYCALNGANWTSTETANLPWNLNLPMNTWGGVGFNEDNTRIKEIRFEDVSGVYGILPDLQMDELKNLIINKEDGLADILGLEGFDGLPNLEKIRLIGCNIDTLLPIFELNNSLLDVNLSGNKFEGTLPIWGNLTNLALLNLENNRLTGNIPDSFPIGKMNLREFLVSNSISPGNNFTGILPAFNAPLLERLDISGNCIDSLEVQTNTDLNDPNLQCWKGFNVFGNGITFDDILPNNKVALVTDCGFPRYGGQKPFGKDTLITVQKCTDLKIDLGIDYGIDNNVYVWCKGGVPFDTQNQNFRIFENIVDSQDTGTYTCKVTNPEVPDLVLTSGEITIALDPNSINCTCPNDILSIESTEPIVCWNSPATIILNNTQPELTYQLIGNGIPIGNAITGGGIDTIITNPLTEETVFSIQLSDADDGCEFELNYQITVATTPPPYENLLISPEENEICWAAKTNIFVDNSQMGFEYSLGETGETQEGNGSQLVFQTNDLVENSVFDFTIQYNECSYAIFDTAMVKVRPDPQLDISFIEASPMLLCENGISEITVNPSFPEFNYILLKNDVFESEKSGDINGISIQFNTSPLISNSIYDILVKDVDFPSCIYSFEDSINIAVSKMAISVPSINNPNNNTADGSIDFTISNGFPTYSVLLIPQEKSRNTSPVINNVQSFSLSGLTDRQYILEVKDSAGCFISTGIDLEREEKNSSNIWISPKGEGAGNNANDFILFDTILLNTSVCPQNIVIKNRRGQTIFEGISEDCSIQWEGTNNNNQPLENGTYYYVIVLENGEQKKGFINLTNDN